MSTSITASGNLAALSETDAAFETSGTIATVDVSVGQTVEKGQTIATLETADLDTAVSDAKTG